MFQSLIAVQLARAVRGTPVIASRSLRSHVSPPPGGVGEARLPPSALSEFPDPVLLYKDARHIAIQDDKSAQTFRTAICLVVFVY